MPAGSLSSWTVSSNGTYETSGFVTPPGSNEGDFFNAVATATVTPAAGIWVFTDGPMAAQLEAVEANPDFVNPVLTDVSVPAAAAGVAMAGPGTAAAPGMVSEVISYRFQSPLPADEAFVFWETGYGDQGQAESFTFLAEDSTNAPVAPQHWTFQAVAPFSKQASSVVALPASGTTFVVTPDGSTHPPDVVVVATADVPLTAVTVQAHTGIFDTWGLALVNAVAQNGVGTPPATGGGPQACFLAGTAIATRRGPVPVERLTVGEEVITRFSGVAPVTWLGRRRLSAQRHPHPPAVWPIRFRRDAVAPGVPARDLLLSPDHAVFLGGVLVPAKHLVNGCTIFQDRSIDLLDYWHVELARHDVVLAEALPAETYLDTGNRHTFENATNVIALHPTFAPWRWERDACARLMDGGPVVDSIRILLLARAAALRANAVDRVPGSNQAGLVGGG